MVKQVITPAPIQDQMGTNTWQIWFNRLRDILNKNIQASTATNGTVNPTLTNNGPSNILTTTNTGWLEIQVNGETMYIPYWK
jgi:hypothetical protein